ncbi:hypothetical protein [Pseudomonas sp. IT-P100]|uniref:hypothetical protein n=1 Tax=Pseudomonas sp. IT-P100 TaxID=3026452 RepID=UPI0039E073A6
MNIAETNLRMRGRIGVIEEMRVWPTTCRNIRNIICIYKNIYKKHIDNKKHIIANCRNIPERAGTFPAELFRECSGYPVSRNIATSLTSQGFQPISQKKCSGMFRRMVNGLRTLKTQAGRELQPIPSLLFRMFRRTGGHTHLFSANA